MMLILKTWKCFTPHISGKPSVQVTCWWLIIASLWKPTWQHWHKPCRNSKYLFVPMTMCSFAGVQTEVRTQWPSTGTGDRRQTSWQWERLLKCFEFTGAGRAGCQSCCGWWCASVTSSEALSLFVCLSRDRFYNICWHVASQVCCAPVWAGEMLLGGNLIKDCQCNATQLFNNVPLKCSFYPYQYIPQKHLFPFFWVGIFH